MGIFFEFLLWFLFFFTKKELSDIKKELSDIKKEIGEIKKDNKYIMQRIQFCNNTSRKLIMKTI